MLVTYSEIYEVDTNLRQTIGVLRTSFWGSFGGLTKSKWQYYGQAFGVAAETKTNESHIKHGNFIKRSIEFL